MSKKGYVTDVAVAATIQRAAHTGNAWNDLKAAAEIVCQRLSSRDDDKTVAAFRVILGSAEPLDKTPFDYIIYDGGRADK